VKQSANDATLVAHTLSVQDKLANLLLDLRRAESGQRGYLITNETAYLEDYQASAPEAEATLRELATLTSDNPERKGRGIKTVDGC
jgi:CHASE3 domain sensor protein